MITYLETSVFESPAQTLVNTVNTVGVMGKGIAKEFKSRYPVMYTEYRHFCDVGKLKVGDLHLWRGDKRWVLNFPTKTTWKLPSKIEYIAAGLEKFVEAYPRLGITSASFPPLGCGNGNLEWDEVRPLMEKYLSGATIPIYIHDVQVGKDFVPEHSSTSQAPMSFDLFWDDILAAVQRNKGQFSTSREGLFVVSPDLGQGLVVQTASGKRRIDKEILEESWLSLRDRTLSIQNYPSETTRKLKSYLFPILSQIPYVVRAQVRHPNSQHANSEGLFINRESFRGYDSVGQSSGEQGCLFPQN